MKRLCIFVTYDHENIVDDYIGYLLQQLRKVVDGLAVVCNYEYIAKGIDKIRPYADKVYYRNNTGFDAGAYKDAICSYLGWDEINKYEELLLVNDSFYGPFYPVEDWVCAMENTDADYWGMIRCPKGKFEDGYTYGAHLQSYFLAFRKSVLESPCFRAFWEQLEYPASLYQAVIDFEIGCNRWLESHGMKGMALTDLCQMDTVFQENEIPYLRYSMELIRDGKVPIIKRRSLYFQNKGFANALEALKYIEDRKLYDVGFIKKHLARISRLPENQDMMDLEKLSHFCRMHPQVYLYGAGVYGQNLASFFKYMGWHHAGFLVTDPSMQTVSCTAFCEARLEAEDGIIIAVEDRDIAREILQIVEERCDEAQILYPHSFP